MVVCPAQNDQRPQVSIDVFRNGMLISSASPELPRIDRSGTVPFVAGIRGRAGIGNKTRKERSVSV
jgi:hypothetical protein